MMDDPHATRTDGVAAAPATSAATLGASLVALLEEPFATCEDVGLDVRRVERQGESEPGDSHRDALILELADGAEFRLAIARTA